MLLRAHLYFFIGAWSRTTPAVSQPPPAVVGASASAKTQAPAPGGKRVYSFEDLLDLKETEAAKKLPAEISPDLIDFSIVSSKLTVAFRSMFVLLSSGLKPRFLLLFVPF